MGVVCKQTTIQAGESDDYYFKGGTSSRKVHAATCIGAKLKSDESQTGNKGEKKRCVASIKSDGSFGVRCGYSSSDYQDIRSP